MDASRRVLIETPIARIRLARRVELPGLVQKIGDINRLIRSESCLLSEWARAALRVSPQIGALFTECATASPLRSDMFRYEVRDCLDQYRSQCQWHGHQLVFQFISNDVWRDFGHGILLVSDEEFECGATY
jgi:hypothetical protein